MGVKERLEEIRTREISRCFSLNYELSANPSLSLISDHLYLSLSLLISKWQPTFTEHLRWLLLYFVKLRFVTPTTYTSGGFKVGELLSLNLAFLLSYVEWVHGQRKYKIQESMQF